MSRTVVTFDGYELTNNYYVSDLRTSLLPRTIESQDVPGRDGSLFTGVRLAPRTITLTLTIKNKSIAVRQAAARALAAILAVDEPRPLSLSIDGGLYFMAIPQSSDDATRWVNASQFEVTFECPDPVAYGQERTVTVPSGGSVTFTVGGTYQTRPVISASAARNNAGIGGWRIALEDGSYIFATIPSGVSSAPVIADCAARTLKVNGNTALLIPAADWLVLEPGEHTLTMTGTGAATVTFDERWL